MKNLENQLYLQKGHPSREAFNTDKPWSKLGIISHFLILYEKFRFDHSYYFYISDLIIAFDYYR